MISALEKFTSDNQGLTRVFSVVARRSAESCAVKVQKDWNRASVLDQDGVQIAQAVGVNPRRVRIIREGRLELPPVWKPDVLAVAVLCGFLRSEIPVALYGKEGSIFYIDPHLFASHKRELLCASMMRAAWYENSGMKEFVLRSMIDMAMTKQPHRGTPLQEELDLQAKVLHQRLFDATPAASAA